ncbi:FadR/GntR family transcriptional regulator [Clostridium sporogenes]|uniref:GntR family transcriptional regulator n=1 Tax=Clostridium sporogenes TaxID=1509 RepID=A0A7U4JMF1_CLOSG|nr:FadR/GntR family transcriptional regulator [Clostridium sporogenes]AVP59766.1 FadR family transcriptional regulator [Clostridium botulinum]AKC61821.1 GntR family transcriptional regulator [Clostridium sporogenes]AKJ89130.1 GntR family transcriptional regulator [Clostridium sporogenes]EHN16654.1 GntR family transcriptional regulator [Clostridium sporogenes PA 3679]KCZ69128.1 GntR family transcriptional regulator [Clostridium sporogenes]
MFMPIKNAKVYEQVIEQIKIMIVSGNLQKGDKLPSERELVDQLKVSRTSIREALRALEIVGLIKCKQGEGNFIRDNFDNSLFEPLSLVFMLEKSNKEDIIEVRGIIEVEATALAAKRITKEQLKKLEHIIDEIKNIEDEKLLAKLDKNFHYEIAQASNNFILLNIINSCSSLIDSLIQNARYKIIKNNVNKEELVNQHEKIYLALKEKDAELASKLMREHLEFSSKFLNI